jgi:hypothetical protein
VKKDEGEKQKQEEEEEKEKNNRKKREHRRQDQLRNIEIREQLNIYSVSKREDGAPTNPSGGSRFHLQE